MENDEQHFFKIDYSIWNDEHFKAINPDVKLVYCALCSFRGGKKSRYPDQCFPSVKKLAEVTGHSRQKVMDAIRLLFIGGFIGKEPLRHGERNITLYTIYETPKEPTQGFFECLRIDNMKKEKAKQKTEKMRNAKKKKKNIRESYSKNVKNDSISTEKESCDSYSKNVKEFDVLTQRSVCGSYSKNGTICNNELGINEGEKKDIENKNKKELGEEDGNKTLFNYIPSLDELF